MLKRARGMNGNVPTDPRLMIGEENINAWLEPRIESTQSCKKLHNGRLEQEPLNFSGLGGWRFSLGTNQLSFSANETIQMLDR